MAQPGEEQVGALEGAWKEQSLEHWDCWDTWGAWTQEPEGK